MSTDLSDVTSDELVDELERRSVSMIISMELPPKVPIRGAPNATVNTFRTSGTVAQAAGLAWLMLQALTKESLGNTRSRTMEDGIDDVHRRHIDDDRDEDGDRD